MTSYGYMVKLKARDIIPGWPKGRTTVSGDRWLNYPPWWRNWSEEEFQNIRYHQQQAAMARKFLEAGKPLTMEKVYGPKPSPTFLDLLQEYFDACPIR